MCVTPKICVPKETKDRDVKAFNTITNKDDDDAKAMTEHISCICKWKFNSTTYSKNGIIKHPNVNVKNIVSAKKIMVRILAHVFVRTVSI